MFVKQVINEIYKPTTKKTDMQKQNTFLLLILMVLILQGCEKEKTGPKDILNPNTKQFNIDSFESDIVSGLQGQSVGFCYVIVQNGIVAKSGALGNRRTANDGDVPQSLTAPMYTASVTKAITTVASLRIMENKKISINSPIINYLPTTWTKGANINKITFRQLLRHRSGFRGNPDTYQGLKDLIAAGVTLSDTIYQYDNSNFALFRVLMTYMDGKLTNDGIVTDQVIEQETTNFYRTYILNQLFSPIDITNVDTKPVGGTPTLYYNFPFTNNTRGWQIGDRINRLGGGGWYISALDVAKFFTYLRGTETFISKETRKMMDDNFLGYDEFSSNQAANDHGIYPTKNGALSNSGDEQVSQGVLNIVKYFPVNNVIAVVMINSRGGNHDSQVGSTSLNVLLRDAFDSAWE
jgi:D-alanyl-D-alanine carboxypeptidase